MNKSTIVKNVYKFVTRDYRDGYTNTVDYIETGRWIELPESEIERNGKACGKGLHLMKRPAPLYEGRSIGFLAVGKDILGQDDNKIRVRAIKLIRPLRFTEIFFPGANLSDANLTRANLSDVNLSGMSGFLKWLRRVILICLFIPFEKGIYIPHTSE